MKSLTCHCGELIEPDFPDVIDLDRGAESRARILDGSFLSLVCPKCGTELKPEIPIRVLENSHQLDIFLVPDLDRINFHRNDLPYSIPAESRIVIGYAELVEKIQVLQHGLDERVVEILKSTLLSRIMGETERTDFHIYFKDLQESQLEFYIDGLKDDEIGISRIPRTAYDKAEENLTKSLKKDPFSRILMPPYISINRLFFEER